MYSSLFEDNFAKSITQQASEAPAPAMAAGAGTVTPLEAAKQDLFLMDMDDRRLQRAANILQSVAALIAIIYFLNGLFKK